MGLRASGSGGAHRERAEYPAPSGRPLQKAFMKRAKGPSGIDACRLLAF